MFSNLTDYEIYVFLLCLVVYVLLATLSVVCITIVTKLSLRIIRGGLDDEKIVQEYEKNKKREKLNKVIKVVDYTFTSVVCLVFAALFVASLIVDCSDTSICGNLAQYRVVQTGSMSKKHEKNTYLYLNNINDQIQTFDLIKTEKLPDEMDLELYDIVVYEVDDMLIVHRIVEIEEPNENHPDCRYFKLQGDAVESPDRHPVYYSQMRAIYTGDRIPFVGSFVLFMQSPAGWFCIILIVIGMIAAPILDKKLQTERDKRLALYFASLSEGENKDDNNEGNNEEGNNEETNEEEMVLEGATND